MGGEVEISVRAVDETRARAEIGYFALFLRDFLAYTDDDRRRILTSATLVLPASRELLDAVYGTLLQFSSTRKYFVGSDGEVNTAFLEKRRKTLFEWLAMTATGAIDERLAEYIEEVAVRHVKREDPADPPIPLAEIHALFGVLHAALVVHLAELIEDPRELGATQSSWVKMLSAQQALFAHCYARVG